LSADRPEPGRSDPRAPYPDLRGALMLTLLATLSAALIGVLLMDLGTLAAVGVGQALGMGAIATMAARRVPEPQAERLGLPGFDPRAILAVLCLAPALLLASELDNVAASWVGASESQSERGSESGFESQGENGIETQSETQSESPGESAGADEDEPEAVVLAPLIDPEDPWSLLQAIVVLAGISPVVEEFLFRGVIQQGLAARLGLLRGVAFTALLWTLLRPAPVDHWLRFLAAAIASLGLGCALGIVRVATGSILASILLSSLWSAIGLTSLALEGSVDLPGLNVEHSHLPWPVLLASAGLVFWAGRRLHRRAEDRFRVERAAFGLEGPGIGSP